MNRRLIAWIGLSVALGAFVLLESRQQPEPTNPPEPSPAGQAVPRVVPEFRSASGADIRNRLRAVTEDVARAPSDTNSPAPVWTGQGGKGSAASADAIPNEFVLGFFNNADRDAFAKLARSRGVEVVAVLDLSHALRIRVGSREQLDALLRDGPTPQDNAPNYRVRAPEPPGGEEPAKPTGVYTAFGRFGLEWLGVREVSPAWGKGVTIAVLDTAIVPNPALSDAKILRHYVGVDTASQDSAVPGHGTAVASLLVGRSPDVTGLAPGATVLSIPVLDREGIGDAFTVARGIVDAVDRGAAVINLSLGSRSDSFILRDAVAYAQRKGVVIVAAVGNDGVEGVSYPARYEGVVGVAAIDATERHMFFSNSGDGVALAAPGAGVNAAWTGGKAGEFSGTSAATPFVSGALAVLLSQNQGMSAQEAAALLVKYADDAGAPGNDKEFGAGILNMARLLGRNTKGIYDAAVGGPYLTPAATEGGDPSVAVYVQNRGTEPLSRVRLTVTVAGAREEIGFRDVGIGQTASHAIPLSTAALEREGSLIVEESVVIDDREDANPGNNVRRSTILLKRP